MARRPTGRSGAAGPVSADDGGWDGDSSGRRPRRPRAGTGGRWWVWIGRAVLWAFILVVTVNGIWLPLRDGFPRPDAQESPRPQAAQSFPETAAAAFALRFTEIYLDSETDGTERAEALAGFLPEGEATAFNLDGAAELAATDIHVLGVDPQDDHYAVVSVAALVNDRPMGLDVPVYTGDGTAFVVSGEPALLAAPETAALPEPPAVDTDPEAREQLEDDLQLFFKHYAEAPELLGGLVENGGEIAPLPEDTLEFVRLDDILVPEPAAGTEAAADTEDVRRVQAVVVWRLADGDADDPTELTQSYQVTVVADGTSWRVRDIQGAPRSFGV